MTLSKKHVLLKMSGSIPLNRRDSFSSRVCKLIRDEEFDGVLDSSQLTHVLNEGSGKKIRASNLTALMNPLLREDVVKGVISGNGRDKKRYWFPAWIDKKKVGNDLSSSGLSMSHALFVTGSNAWTDSNVNLPKIIDTLRGDLCVVDQFYGNGTFFTLAKFGKERKVRFLSAKLGNEEQENRENFNLNLKKFKNQFTNIKLRKYDKYWELHDRYIIADNGLVVVGYGIKDFGNKESFVIFLPKKQVSSFLPVLKSFFEKRWQKSNDII